jgi:ABC-type lipoprotein export system ATPase subunit
MDFLNLSAKQLVDQAKRFSAITGLTKSSPEDRFFLVMGKTGSGKSTFIARCTGQNVTVGHGLYSCMCLLTAKYETRQLTGML